MALEQELRTYHEHLAELRAFEGKFVLIHKARVIDTFVAYEDALKRGYQECGLEPFLVKRINTHEVAHTITRLLVPDCALTPA